MISRICLFVLFLIFGNAVQFGACENERNDCANISHGSDKTILTYFEKIWEYVRPQSKATIASLVKNDKKSVSIRNFLTEIKEMKGNIAQPFTIFPGTLWCGDGDNAKSEDDLGSFNDTDACCRAHDNCEHNISAGDTKENIYNNGRFTRSACLCDHDFYNCLKKVNSYVSYGVGFTYFNFLRPQCYKCTCPKRNCKPETDLLKCHGHCAKYEWIDCRKF